VSIHPVHDLLVVLVNLPVTSVHTALVLSIHPVDLTLVLPVYPLNLTPPRGFCLALGGSYLTIELG
jgi:hypothetical protein